VDDCASWWLVIKKWNKKCFGEGNYDSMKKSTILRKGIQKWTKRERK
jgi:hypothetical protein